MGLINLMQLLIFVFFNSKTELFSYLKIFKIKIVYVVVDHKCFPVVFYCEIHAE